MFTSKTFSILMVCKCFVRPSIQSPETLSANYMEGIMGSIYEWNSRLKYFFSC